MRFDTKIKKLIDKHTIVDRTAVGISPEISHLDSDSFISELYDWIAENYRRYFA